MKSALSTVAILLLWPFAGHAAGLQPFVASYEAWHGGKRAGTATMRLAPAGDERWQVDLGIRGDRGFAGLVGLDIAQSTLFDEAGGHYRPLSQTTLRKAAVIFNRRIAGSYDWDARTAQWSGDVRRQRRQPVPLQDGDMSALLINLAVVRDAEPGRTLHYRYVDGGRVREHAYRVSPASEAVQVGELSYEAVRVERTNAGGDDTVLWVASGVPTPVRILHRENGEDNIDLRLVEYQGVL